MRKFDHIHSSSKFNRSPRSLKGAFDAYAKDSELLTFTEVEFEDREKVLRSNKNWTSITGDKSNRNDCAIVTRDSFFENIYDEQWRLSQGYARGNGRSDDIYATFSVIEDPDENGLVVGVAHMPASVEADLLSKKRTSRTVVWYRCYRRFIKRAKYLKRKFKAKAILLVADWNTNFKKLPVRRLFRALSPGFKVTWIKYPKGGTHGNRIIDASLTKGKIKLFGTARLFKDDDSSDHRPYAETLAVRA